MTPDTGIPARLEPRGPACLLQALWDEDARCLLLELLPEPEPAPPQPTLARRIDQALGIEEPAWRVVLGPLEGLVPLRMPGQVLPARPAAPSGSSLTAPALGWLSPAESEAGKGQAGILQPRAGWVEPEALADRPVSAMRVSQIGTEE